MRIKQTIGNTELWRRENTIRHNGIHDDIPTSRQPCKERGRGRGEWRGASPSDFRQCRGIISILKKMKQKDSVLYTLMAMAHSGIFDKLLSLKYVTWHWDEDSDYCPWQRRATVQL